MILATPEVVVGWVDGHYLGRVGALASAAIDAQNKTGVTDAHGRSSLNLIRASYRDKNIFQFANWCWLEVFHTNVAGLSKVPHRPLPPYEKAHSGEDHQTTSTNQQQPDFPPPHPTTSTSKGLFGGSVVFLVILAERPTKRFRTVPSRAGHCRLPALHFISEVNNLMRTGLLISAFSNCC